MIIINIIAVFALLGCIYWEATQCKRCSPDKKIFWCVVLSLMVIVNIGCIIFILFGGIF